MGQPDLQDVVRTAANRVIANWEEVQLHATSEAEVAEGIQAIETALDQPPEADLATVPSPLSRRLVVLLRRALIEEVIRRDVPPAEAVALLHRLEGIAARLESPWDHHFSDQLSGPDGLELVVEVAHDLRSPLTSILFLAETLQRGQSGPISPLQERQLGLIYSAAFGLSAVASDVIELARGGDRLVDIEPMPFSVSDILQSVRDIVLPIAEEKGLEVKLEHPEAPVRVGHPVAINRVLLNLTTNALKFTDEGFVQVTASDGEDGVVRFVVRDTGRGIPPRALSMLFEPFRRRQRDREYFFSGSGLGLSICRKLVETMGGELEVTTSEGEGTQFSFALSLPVATSGMDHLP